MKILTVTFKKKFPAGAYLNEDIGFEAGIDDVEDVMSAINKLRDIAEQAHKIKYPYYYGSDGTAMYETEKEINVQDNDDSDRVKSIIATINYANSLTVLQRFKHIVDRENNPEILAAYNKKQNSLINEQK